MPRSRLTRYVLLSVFSITKQFHEIQVLFIGHCTPTIVSLPRYKRQVYRFGPAPLASSPLERHEFSFNEDIMLVLSNIVWSDALRISIAFKRQKRALAGRLSESRSASASSVILGLAFSAS